MTLNDPDDSERYEVIIQDNLPPGTRIFGANDQEIVPRNGVYTISQQDADALTLLSPPNYSSALSGNIILEGTVVVTEEENGSTASDTFTISIDIEGVADPPLARSVGPVPGVEDQPYFIGPFIDINGALIDVSKRICWSGLMR